MDGIEKIREPLACHSEDCELFKQAKNKSSWLRLKDQPTHDRRQM